MPTELERMLAGELYDPLDPFPQAITRSSERGGLRM
jgi:hypothetical protein